MKSYQKKVFSRQWTFQIVTSWGWQITTFLLMNNFLLLSKILFILKQKLKLLTYASSLQLEVTGFFKFLSALNMFLKLILKLYQWTSIFATEIINFNKNSYFTTMWQVKRIKLYWILPVLISVFLTWSANISKWLIF